MNWSFQTSSMTFEGKHSIALTASPASGRWDNTAEASRRSSMFAIQVGLPIFISACLRVGVESDYARIGKFAWIGLKVA